MILGLKNILYIQGRKKMSDYQAKLADPTLTTEQKREIRLERKREYSRQAYAKNYKEHRERCLNRYYEKKAQNPDFHNKPKGRPPKYSQEIVEV